MAAGMVYLHSRSIIHRDLKSLNFLVDEHFIIKVCDFGASRVKADQAATMTTIGTPAWTAPEVLQGLEYTEKADVYSFGVVLWEVVTRANPYAGMEPMQICMKVMMDNVRPPMPPDCPPAYRSLIERCWDRDPAVRPSFLVIVDEVDAMLAEDCSYVPPDAPPSPTRSMLSSNPRALRSLRSAQLSQTPR